MFYYITPVTSQTIAIGPRQQTVLAPKYCSTDMAGSPYVCMPYGSEGWCVVALGAENAALASEPDVYSFPPNLAATMQDSDVTTLAAFLANANVPSDQIITGMTFEEALVAIITIFLVAQAIYGSTGSSIFADGSTLDTAISDTSASLVVPSNAQAKKGIGVGASAGNSGSSSSSLGPFDFSNIDPSASVNDVLIQMAQQFTSPIIVGSDTLGS